MQLARHNPSSEMPNCFEKMLFTPFALSLYVSSGESDLSSLTCMLQHIKSHHMQYVSLYPMMHAVHVTAHFTVKTRLKISQRQCKWLKGWGLERVCNVYICNPVCSFPLSLWHTHTLTHTHTVFPAGRWCIWQIEKTLMNLGKVSSSTH